MTAGIIATLLLLAALVRIRVERSRRRASFDATIAREHPELTDDVFVGEPLPRVLRFGVTKCGGAPWL